jgi:hypothetical protein
MRHVYLIAVYLVACSDPSAPAPDLAMSVTEPDLAVAVDLGEEEEDLAAPLDMAVEQPPDLAGVDFGPAVGSVTIMAAGSTTLTAVGAQVQLSATASDFDGGTITGGFLSWRSDSTLVATVNGAGLVTAVGNGTTLIRAKAGPNMAEATISITVSIAVASVTVAPAASRVADSKTGTLVATARDSGGNAILGGVTFTWTSGDPTHAPVSSSGVVTGALSGSFGLGPITITASAEGKDGTAQVSIAVYKTWSFATGGSGLTVDVTQNQYLVLKNPDNSTHSLVLDDNTVIFSNFNKGDSQAAQITRAPGSYPFHCGVHGSAMTGTLVVH